MTITQTDYGPPGTVVGVWPIDLGELPLDQVDEYGGVWNVLEFAGKGSPPTAIDVQQRTNAHGAWIGGRFYAAKPYTISGAYEGGTPADRFAAEQRLLRVAGVDDVTMTMHEEISRQTTVMLNGEIEIDAVNDVAFTFQLPLIAADPFRYAVADSTDAAGAPMVTGSLDWVDVWAAVFDGTSDAAATMTASNVGTREVFPTFRVYGPLTAFALVAPAQGKLLTVDLSVGSGWTLTTVADYVDVDMARQTIIADDGRSSRRAAARGDFFSLPVGDADVIFGSPVAHATSHAVMTYRSVWT